VIHISVHRTLILILITWKLPMKFLFSKDSFPRRF